MHQQKPTLVLLHGWAVHSEIWHGVEAGLEEHFHLHPIDFPGYGTRHAEAGQQSLSQLTQDAIKNAPPKAHWLGWSLGAMVAMSAAIETPALFESLTLISPSPKFVQSDDWQHGIDESALGNLQERFEQNYDVALKRFLLLQAGMDKDARDAARKTYQMLQIRPAPNSGTLGAGLNVLRQTDLRQIADRINVPTQIIACIEDRVIPHAASAALHQIIPRSKLTSLPTGHAPMIESPQVLVKTIVASTIDGDLKSLGN